MEKNPLNNKEDKKKLTELIKNCDVLGCACPHKTRRGKPTQTRIYK